MNGTKITGTERVFGLDVMRAAAILMVLGGHLLWIYPDCPKILSQLFTLFGFWGVELFFVLSGFLIGGILYRLFLQTDFTRATVFYFLQRRWFRTLPNYFLVLLFNCGIGVLFGFQMTHAGYYFLFLQNFATTMPAFFPESWSLSVEEFAYLISVLALFAAAILIPGKNRSRLFITVVLGLIAVFIGIKVGYYCWTSNTTLIQWNVSLKAVVIYRIDSILIGAAFSWLSLNYPEFWAKQKIKMAASGCVLIVLMYVGVGFFRILIADYPFFWNVLYLPVTSLTFALFLPVLSGWKTAPAWLLKPVTLVSLISYSVYLLHYSLILQLLKYWIDTTALVGWQLHLFTIMYLGITFLLSYLLYRYYEKPLMALRK